MCPIKFPTKPIFPIFHILKINRIMPFCNLFIGRPSYTEHGWAFTTKAWTFVRSHSRSLKVKTQDNENKQTNRAVHSWTWLCPSYWQCPEPPTPRHQYDVLQGPDCTCTPSIRKILNSTATKVWPNCALWHNISIPDAFITLTAQSAPQYLCDSNWYILNNNNNYNCLLYTSPSPRD